LSDQEKTTGVIEQNGEFAITRVVDTIHYVKKKNGPLLQVADACAYGFKRYFEGLGRGDEMVRAILGGDLANPEAWTVKGNSSTFQWTKPKPLDPSEVIPFRKIL
jgi:hypothetical protein